MLSGRFYVSKAPQAQLRSSVGRLLVLKRWDLRHSWGSSSSGGLPCPVDFLPQGRNTEQWALLASVRHSLAQLPANVLGKMYKGGKGTFALGCHRRGTYYFSLLLLTCPLFQTVMCKMPMQLQTPEENHFSLEKWGQRLSGGWRSLWDPAVHF